MSECVYEKPVMRKGMVRDECVVIKPSVSEGYARHKAIKRKRNFHLPEKSRSRLLNKIAFNPKIFEEFISVKEIKRNFHFQNFAIG